MTALALPLLGTVMVFGVLLPVSALLARLVLHALDRLAPRWPPALPGLRYVLLVGSSTFPIAWLLGACLQQAVAGTGQSVCVIPDPPGVLCPEVAALAVLVTSGALSAAIFVLVQGRRGRFEPARDPALRARLRRLARRAPELARLLARVDVSWTAPAPIATIGLLRPRVVLDPRFAQSLDDDSLLAALRHEAAHVRARDPLRYALLHWALRVHPAGRWLLGGQQRRWLLAHESGCDRDAVLAGSPPAALAHALVRAARFDGPRLAAPLPARDVAGLRLRVELLLAYPEGGAPAAIRRPRETPALRVALLGTLLALLAPQRVGSGLLDALHRLSESVAGIVATTCLGARRARAQSAPRAVAQSESDEPRESDLAELWGYAERHAPALELARLRRGEAAAAFAEARPVFPDNPTLHLGIGARLAERTGIPELFASLEQPLDLAGRRSAHLEIARHRAERIDAELELVRLQLRRDLARAYADAVVARRRLEIMRGLERFAAELYEASRRQQRVGEHGALEPVAAQRELVRARDARIRAERDLLLARLALCEATGWPPQRPPMPRLEPFAPQPVPPLDALGAAAEASHPEQRARQGAGREARARMRLAGTERWPMPSVGAELHRETGADASGAAQHVLLGTVSTALPLWQTNEPGRIEARVRAAIASFEQREAERQRRIRIARAHAELRAAAERLALYETAPSSLEPLLAAMQRSVEAGELSSLELAAVRDRWLQAQLDALEAWRDHAHARAELEHELGVPLPVAGNDAGTDGP
ncbi:MAG: TolC family protein [Myxococcales bacterium]|nr:TolC family protein [Myxococcales bacterium]